jgi:pyruvate/2-oxoglutarate dehydrogenase complex dihydrolipoamide acyltransferase (E2) component
MHDHARGLDHGLKWLYLALSQKPNKKTWKPLSPPEVVPSENLAVRALPLLPVVNLSSTFVRCADFFWPTPQEVITPVTCEEAHPATGTPRPAASTSPTSSPSLRSRPQPTVMAINEEEGEGEEEEESEEDGEEEGKVQEEEAEPAPSAPASAPPPPASPALTLSDSSATPAESPATGSPTSLRQSFKGNALESASASPRPQNVCKSRASQRPNSVRLPWLMTGTENCSCGCRSCWRRT